MSDEIKKLTSQTGLEVPIDRIKELRQQEKAQVVQRTEAETKARQEAEAKAISAANAQKMHEASQEISRKLMEQEYAERERRYHAQNHTMRPRDYDPHRQLPVKPVQEFPGVPSRGEIEYYGLVEVQQKMTIRPVEGKPQTITAIVWIGLEDWRHPRNRREVPTPFYDPTIGKTKR